MARILAIVSDLMLASRVKEGLAGDGHEVSILGSLPDRVDAEAIVCDLDTVDPREVAATGVPALGFYSHVDVETRREAEAAGIDLIVPRSRMSRELPELLSRVLGDG